MKKYDDTNKLNLKKIDLKSPDEDLKFILWKSELNRELSAFWKALSD
jgi:hypothetical protein